MYEIYEVVTGGTISDISNNLGIDANLLMEINGMPKDMFVEAGRFIVIPKEQQDNFIKYTIKNGDTIIDIARKYGIDYKQLLDLNGLDKEEYLYIGQQILVPNKNVNFWITGENDTLKDVAGKFNVDIADVVDANDNIFLRPDQMLIIKKKD